ncbi:hypothetical protein C8255_23620 [filamentous cyanobacterium CCP3]|nr:hypothetical protein C8255_23620 [filamentous cyanobacterium CCP3]
MKWKPLVVVLAMALAVTLAGLQIKRLVHQRALSACIAQLERLANEADRNPNPVIEPFQAFPVNAKNGYRPTVFGYKDQEGKTILPETFIQAKSFREGKAAVANRNWAWGFIDPEGQLVIPYRFGSVSNFYDGVAAFSGIDGKKPKQGFIDKNGTVIILLKSDGGSFVSNFLGFKHGYIQSTRFAWAPFHGNPHPTVSISIDCTGRVTERK